jgi:hypothetical protein
VIRKGVSIGQALERPGESEFTRVEGLVKVLQEETAEETGQDPNRQEEAGSAGDPPGAIWREAAAGDDKYGNAVPMETTERFPQGLGNPAQTAGLPHSHS